MSPMLKYLFPAFLILAMTQCGIPDHKSEHRSGASTHNSRIDVVRIDGCEYLIMKGYNHKNGMVYTTKAGGITHKANCDNPFHENNDAR